MPDCKLCHLTRGVVRDNQHWTMAVNENQATLGRVFFALKRHETDVTRLTADEVSSLWTFLAEAKEALMALFAPDHFNYMFHMNLDPHCHMHIYPRYAAPREFAGQVFPDSRYGDHYDPAENHPLDDATREALVTALRHQLSQPTRNFAP
jgi:diadenosine tetraphosphate (Ap4A) HIT family hydrolase